MENAFHGARDKDDHLSTSDNSETINKPNVSIIMIASDVFIVCILLRNIVPEYGKS